jgi:hypothetical protein
MHIQERADVCAHRGLAHIEAGRRKVWPNALAREVHPAFEGEAGLPLSAKEARKETMNELVILNKNQCVQK